MTEQTRCSELVGATICSQLEEFDAFTYASAKIYSGGMGKGGEE